MQQQRQRVGAFRHSTSAAAKIFAKPEDKRDPRIDRVHTDLKRLPPVTLINARIDPLRSDDDMLKRAGVKLEHRVFDGVTHEFFGMSAVVAKAKQAPALAGEQLKKSFADASAQ